MLPVVLAGVPGSFLGVTLAKMIETELLSKMFAVLIAAVGIRELFHKKTEEKK